MQLYLYTNLGAGAGAEDKVTINTASFALYPPISGGSRDITKHGGPPRRQADTWNYSH